MTCICDLFFLRTHCIFAIYFKYMIISDNLVRASVYDCMSQRFREQRLIENGSRRHDCTSRFETVRTSALLSPAPPLSLCMCLTEYEIIVRYEDLLAIRHSFQSRAMQSRCIYGTYRDATLLTVSILPSLGTEATNSRNVFTSNDQIERDCDHIKREKEREQ